MKIFTLLSFVVVLFGCASAPKNSLVGKWKSHEEKTLDSVRNTPGVTEKAMHLFEHDFFGKLINEYSKTTSKTYYENPADNIEGFNVPESYKILEETESYYLLTNKVTELTPNKTVKLYKDGNCYYVFVSRWNFKEYFCRIE